MLQSRSFLISPPVYPELLSVEVGKSEIFIHSL